jgi:hypothetical protein
MVKVVSNTHERDRQEIALENTPNQCLPGEINKACTVNSSIKIVTKKNPARQGFFIDRVLFD